MSATVQLPDDADVSTCDIHDCDEPPASAYHGFSTEDDRIYLFTAFYCPKHASNHAEPHDRIFKLGGIGV